MNIVRGFALSAFGLDAYKSNRVALRAAIDILLDNSHFLYPGTVEPVRSQFIPCVHSLTIATDGSNTINRLQVRHGATYLQEAIPHCEELLASHYPVGHQYRLETLDHLASLLQMRFDATGQHEDLSRIASLKAEANQSSNSTSTT